jgi:hypothetical protein
MNIPPFKLEEFWKKYEFNTPHLFCCSDTEAWSMQELLSLADTHSQTLWHSLSLGYTESPGHPLLRKEIAELYSLLSPDNIITFAGDRKSVV